MQLAYHIGAMKVISLGGSIVVPNEVDADYLRDLRSVLVSVVENDDRLIVVVGGGAPARRYQTAYRTIRAALDLPVESDSQDWIGVMATRINAELVRHVLAPYVTDPVVTDPTAAFAFTGRILVAAGWKPGFSTDFDAVMLAERFGADTVINLSNVAQVYTADPRTVPDATPLEHVSWDNFRALVGESWKPGSNLPFDPVATRKAAGLGLRVIAADGKNLENLTAILTDQEFFGTEIGPE